MNKRGKNDQQVNKESDILLDYVYSCYYSSSFAQTIFSKLYGVQAKLMG